MIDARQKSLLQAEESEKQAIRHFFGDRSDGFFVEVGANEPTSPESQTFHLEQLGWRGILVEPIPELAEKARQLRPNSTVWQAACSAHGSAGEVELLIPLDGTELVTGHASLRANIDEHNYRNFKRIRVKSTTLDQVLAQAGMPSVDLLSIDVEGAELEVLRGLDLTRSRPRLILLEDKHLYLSKHRLLTRAGYKLVQRLNRNCWYIPREALAPPVPMADRFRLLKRMYVSIWFKKIKYAVQHRSLDPFRTL
jgi:FkbM family methyltransferase